MALNPLSYTEKVVRSFLRYQLTTYPFADERLNEQMRGLLSLDQTRDTPLLKGPYISLSRAFQTGATVESLVSEGVLHEHMRQLIPYPTMYGHQESAIRMVMAGRTTLVSTGTGSGKSECFLYPIISRSLQLRDEGAAPGICAVIVYPMNTLAEDQLGRLRELLAGTGITFGMYVGKTPENEADVTGYRLPPGSSNVDYRAKLAEARAAGEGTSVHPSEEVCSREVMRQQGSQPRILLTNAKQLELLLTRQSDVELFDNARLDFLVFDEAHTFSGATGAEVACLIRRLRSFCGRGADGTVCVATSATIVDPTNPDAARDFASRFFGVERDLIETVGEEYEEEVWADGRAVPAAPADPLDALESARAAVDVDDPGPAVAAVCRKLTGAGIDPDAWEASLHDVLARNELLYQCAELLTVPKSLAELIVEIQEAVGREVSEEELITWLTLGAAARKDSRPLVRPVVHGFLRGVQGAVVTFDSDDHAAVLHLSAEEDEDGDERRLRMPVFTCTTCGQHYYEHSLADLDYLGPAPGGGQAADGRVYWETMDVANGGVRCLFIDRLISSEDDEIDEHHPRLSALHLCLSCGSAHDANVDRCLSCGEQAGMTELQAVQQRQDREGCLSTCVCCRSNGRLLSGRFREPIKPVRAANVKDVHILAQDMIHHAERKRLLIFADNRQDAAFQAGWMRDHARRFGIRLLISKQIAARPISVGDLVHALDRLFDEDDALSSALLPEVWAVAPKEAAGTEHQLERKKLLRILVLRELTIGIKQQIGLEPFGRLKVNYLGLEESAPFIQKWTRALRIPADELVGGVAAMLDQWRRKRLVLDRVHG
ncbi:MAG: DEAD/DEAH box helicase, partial [Gammaproteobacteria bacterium]|nr:DEAD/DEAH box helicase [Gammaproteobacteria bacterium]